ncbi:hypothetical protein HMPREF0762_00487 [Slackia exigua ATCC 700122]|uniref:Uncharacterized protein n=1 Tax=Slackia exigua (strain ATCC 700122 / DSM 15923 / CIP 105133 / JCM 11022 / KCTC 5966 / S-7) TaxID=649764 RepID=D0WFH0_SLAES|nr:hypothetical protein HMPREF0762_00487 [Slackia exigua ATCC 700122]
MKLLSAGEGRSDAQGAMRSSAVRDGTAFIIGAPRARRAIVLGSQYRRTRAYAS